MMEVMDGKCGNIAGKEHCCSNSVGELLEVSCWRCLVVSARMERIRSSSKMVVKLLGSSCWR